MMFVASFMVFEQMKSAGISIATLRITESSIDKANETDNVSVMDEGGASLSGGERQRLSIARAILKDSPIIILDEATANVDPENEDRLQAAIEALMKDKTIIMTTHRLKTVRKADQILVLDGGHIVQRGTHANLSKQDGIYSRFIRQREDMPQKLFFFESAGHDIRC